MSNRISAPAAAGILYLGICLTAIQAQAGPLSFVSSKGANSGNCASAATACLTFQYALSQTAAGGEIKALDPGNYGWVIINKSITITGVDGAGIVRGSPGDAVTINAGAEAVINLTGLTLDGFNKTAAVGIRLNSGGKLTIANCVIRRFGGDGVRLQPTNNSRFAIVDTISADNGGSGISVQPGTAAQVGGTVEGGTLANNLFGMNLIGPAGAEATVAVVNTIAANNANVGFRAGGTSPGYFAILTLRNVTVSGGSRFSNSIGVKADAFGAIMLAHSSVSGNATGVAKAGNGNILTYGDNNIDLNLNDNFGIMIGGTMH
ncbi:right-handed parallel beta-helix repeat-containing protein [Methylocystis sp. ATCC 49242]|uniref:right-handed parallel beta-helix repeat-containing protein n=1 Tax=Methylocystis sp. ATCC 49242 TaxID=622637 RepID=UPI0001F886C8|nr:right-handed parallel beta-helix repeat-containing protein [Methylocystis sp. ATCC 49242]